MTFQRRALDARAEPALEALVRVTAQALGAPCVALGRIVGPELVFTAVTGPWAPSGTAVTWFPLMPRGNSHAVEFEDLAAGTLQRHAWVAGPPYLRFGAGVALRAPSGEAIGVLAIAGPVPRRLGDVERSLLDELARLAQYVAASVAYAPERAREIGAG